MSSRDALLINSRRFMPAAYGLFGETLGGNPFLYGEPQGVNVPLNPFMFPSALPPAGGTTWMDLIGQTLGVFTPAIQAALPGGAQPLGAGFLPLPGGMPQLAVATPTTLAALAVALAGYGIRLIGTIIRTTRTLWARVPAVLKAAAVALGVSVLFDGNGNGEDGAGRARRRRSGISYAQLKGFHRVTALLRKVGMRPKALGYGARRGRVCK
ncbi:MAG: hypothetical protein ACRDGM_11840 [bacterium]